MAGVSSSNIPPDDSFDVLGPLYEDTLRAFFHLPHASQPRDLPNTSLRINPNFPGGFRADAASLYGGSDIEPSSALDSSNTPISSASSLSFPRPHIPQSLTDGHGNAGATRLEFRGGDSFVVQSPRQLDGSAKSPFTNGDFFPASPFPDLRITVTPSSPPLAATPVYQVVGTLKGRKAANLRRRRADQQDRLYPCGLCGADFTRLKNLRNHQNSHYGVRPFACDVCGKQFTTKHTMTRHRAKKHPST